MELKDMMATRSPGTHPSPSIADAARFAARSSDAKSSTRSPRTTAGLSGFDSAWLARKSRRPTTKSYDAYGVAFALGEVVALGDGEGSALHSVLDARPNVDGVGGTLPVTTTRYRKHPPSSSQLADGAQWWETTTGGAGGCGGRHQ